LVRIQLGAQTLYSKGYFGKEAILNDQLL